MVPVWAGFFCEQSPALAGTNNSPSRFRPCRQPEGLRYRGYVSLVVAAAIVDSLEKPRLLLAAQRSYPKDLAGKWELPGGKVEDGEDPESACVREIIEELGVTPELDRILPAPGGDWPIGKHTMRVWIATVDREPVRTNDHAEVRWCTAKEARALEWLPGDVPLVEKLTDWMLGS